MATAQTWQAPVLCLSPQRVAQDGAVAAVDCQGGLQNMTVEVLGAAKAIVCSELNGFSVGVWKIMTERNIAIRSVPTPTLSGV